jgi:hypothetical protein
MIDIEISRNKPAFTGGVPAGCLVSPPSWPDRDMWNTKDNNQLLMEKTTFS